MAFDSPQIVVLAGPNGAGKTTTAPLLLRDTLAVDEFVNADAIAFGLSAFAPEKAALEAGKVFLRHVRELAAKRATFAFETTLASRSFAPWLADLMKKGYRSHLVFLTLPDADYAVQRVATRVELGGHTIPEDVIRRRYIAGLRNFFTLYTPIVTSWEMYDNSIPGHPRIIARGKGKAIDVREKSLFEYFVRGYSHEQA